VRKIAEPLFELCYERLGKEPRFLDAEDVRDRIRYGLKAWLDATLERILAETAS
jgi:hypothetical protein